MVSFVVAEILSSQMYQLLNQAQVRAWFLKIDPVRIVGMRVCLCVCVCVCAQGY